MNDQRNLHDLRIDDERVRSTTEFAGGIAVIRCQDDDAFVVESARLQIGKQLAQAFIYLMHLEGDAVVESRPLPICILPGWLMIASKHVHVHWLGVKEHR